MRPMLWQPPGARSLEEQGIVGRSRRAKGVVVLGERRHELFAEAFQGEGAALCAERPLGQPPSAPAHLGLALLRHASPGVCADQVIEATPLARRWQLVLECVDGHEPPGSTGTLVGLRARLIGQHLDRRLSERASRRSRWVRAPPATLPIRCKAWPVRNGERFPPTAFPLDWPRQQVACPNLSRCPSSRAARSTSPPRSAP